MWLLRNGVSPKAVRWVRPRDAWIQNRASTQPLELLSWLIEGQTLLIEAAAQADGVEDLFRRLEACEQLLRIDPTVEPTMYRCPVVDQRELELLRSVEDVVRKGRVLHIGADQILLEEGSIKTDRAQIHVDCSAAGLRAAPARPIFEPNASGCNRCVSVNRRSTQR